MRAIAPFVASLIVAAFDTYEALVWANFAVALAALGAMWIATRPSHGAPDAANTPDGKT